MALTTIQYVGDGTTTVYDVAFQLGYLRKKYVFVHLKDDDYINQLEYTWLNDTQIQLAVPLPNATLFTITRVVDATALINEYQNGAILRATNLDDSLLQLLLLIEDSGEVQKDALKRKNVGDTENAMEVNLNMNLQQILNLPAPQSKSSPVRLKDVEDMIESEISIVDDKTVTIEHKTLSSGQDIVTFDTLLAKNAHVYVSGVNVDTGRLHVGMDYIERSDIDEFTIQLTSTFATETKLVAYSYGDYTAASIRKSNEFELIAHRGFRSSFPQNTLLAFTSAMKRGATSLECDVQITSDGIPVVFHDSTVDSLTNGTGTIASKTLVEVQSLLISETIGTSLEGVRIPTFESLLKYCKGAGIKLYPEIKAYRTQADISIMIDAIQAYDMEYTAFVSSFSLSDVYAFKALNNTIACGLLGNSSNPVTYEPLIDELAELGNTFIAWSYPALLTVPDIVTYAKQRGLGVQAWTVNDSESAKRLMRRGVHQIMSDTLLEVE